MSEFMSYSNAIEFAGYVRDQLHTKQDILSFGTGIMVRDNVLSLGVFRLIEQPLTYDAGFIGKEMKIYRGELLLYSTVLNDTQAMTLYFGDVGTYSYEIEGVAGIVIKQVTKVYTADGTQPTFNIDYTAPVKAPMYPFATATDQQLTDMINSYYLGLYDSTEENDLKTIYLPVGAKRSIHLAHMEPGDGCEESHFGDNGDDYEFIIIGVDHDNLHTPIGDKTKALLTLDQARILYKNTTDDMYYYYDEGGYGYPSAAAGGGRMHNNSNSSPYTTWETCDRRKWCNNTYFNALPRFIRNAIKEVDKPTYLYIDYNFVLKTLQEKVFFLSEWECWGQQRYRNQEGEQYAYFAQDVKNLDKKPCYNSGSASSPSSYKYTGAYWWLRTMPYSNDFATVYGYSYSGETPPETYTPNYTYEYITDHYGMAPAFCV